MCVYCLNIQEFRRFPFETGTLMSDFNRFPGTYRCPEVFLEFLKQDKTTQTLGNVALWVYLQVLMLKYFRDLVQLYELRCRWLSFRDQLSLSHFSVLLCPYTSSSIFLRAGNPHSVLFLNSVGAHHSFQFYLTVLKSPSSFCNALKYRMVSSQRRRS